MSRLMNYTDTCSEAKVVLLGYSQSAQVVGDVICGEDTRLVLDRQRHLVAKNYSDRVVAMIQMGDPRHMVDTFT